MTEAAPKIPTPPTETEKIIIPMEDEEKQDLKRLILTIMGYCSLVFIVLSLFFPFWQWNNLVEYNYVSLWQATSSGIPYDYWTVFFTFIGDLIAMIPFTYPFDSIIISIVGINFELVFILLLIRYFLRRKFPKGGWFWTCILFGAMYGVGFPALIGFSFSFTPPNIYTPLYGPTWGLAFGWWALFIGSIIAIIRKKWLQKIEREEKEEEESEGLTFKT